MPAWAAWPTLVREAPPDPQQICDHLLRELVPGGGAPTTWRC